MSTHIALFRGINVGGSHLLPMSELKALLEQAGCRDVRTYIQSGNAVFSCERLDARALATKITAAVSRSRGFEPHVIVLTRAELERAAKGNPFPQADGNPPSLHLFFLDAPPKKGLDLAPLDALKTRTEAFALKGTTFYLYTPDGFGRSKLGQRAERLLGVTATARNWRTVTTLLQISLDRSPGAHPESREPRRAARSRK